MYMPFPDSPGLLKAIANIMQEIHRILNVRQVDTKMNNFFFKLALTIGKFSPVWLSVTCVLLPSLRIYERLPLRTRLLGCG